MIFVNLPVTDLAKSIALYEAVGATLNPQFTDETAACMVLSETISIMLLTHDKYRQFQIKPIADAHRSSQVLLCISAESREDVDQTIARAVAAGARPDTGEKQDFGFMYGRNFEDFDGHEWEVMWMDMEALGDRPAAEAAEAACGTSVEA
jgi:predicted lactoylglutathione lyase